MERIKEIILSHFLIAILLPVFILTSTTEILSQQVIVNSKGERIVIYPDGSWRYFEMSDTSLVKQNFQKDEVFVEEEAISNKKPVDPTMEDEDSRRLSIEFANQLEQSEEIAKKALSKATSIKFRADAKYQQGQKNKKLMEPEVLLELEEETEKAIEEVKNAKKYHKTISKLHSKAILLADMPFPKRSKALSKLMAQYGTFVSTSTWAPDQSIIASAIPTKSEEPISATTKPVRKKTDKVRKTRSKEKEISSKNPKIKNERKPPAISTSDQTWAESIERNYVRKPFNCAVQSDKVDDLTQKRRIVLEPGQLFTFTDEDLRPYFRDEELVRCTAFMSKVSSLKYLTIEFKIASSNAQRNFGMLDEGGLIRLKFLDGSFLNLYNMQRDRGHIDSYTGHTVFTGNFVIGKDIERSLLKSEIDKMRVVWSTGYEDYEIYELDFFMNQISCLNNL